LFAENLFVILFNKFIKNKFKYTSYHPTNTNTSKIVNIKQSWEIIMLGNKQIKKHYMFKLLYTYQYKF